MASAIERVPFIATKGIVVALDCVRAGDADHGFVGEGTEGIVEEGGYACGIAGFGLMAKGVVGEGDCRRVVRIDSVGKTAPVVVGVIGCYATRPDAAGELAVRGVGVCRAFTIGVDFVGHGAGGDVVEPGGDVTLRRGGVTAPYRFVPIRRHRGLIAEDVVSVANGVGCAAFIGLVPAKVVFVDNSVAERIGDGREMTELIVGVGSAVTERVNGGRALTERIIFGLARVAASISIGDLPAEGIARNSVSDGGDRDIHQGDTVTRKRQWLVGRVGKRLARGDDGRINHGFVHSDVAADVSRAGTRRERGGKAGELARRGGEERRNGGGGAGDNVGLGEPDVAVNYCNI